MMIDYDMQKHLDDFKKDISKLIDERYKPISKAQAIENEIVVAKLTNLHAEYTRRMIAAFRDTLHSINNPNSRK